MWNSSVCLKGKIMLVVICLFVVLWNANCQTHRPNNFYHGYPEVQQNPLAGKLYGTDNVKNHGGNGYYPLPADLNDNKKWQTLESSVHHYGDGSNAVASTPGLTDITKVAVKGDGPVVVSGGSVVIRPSAGGFVVDGGGDIGTLGEPEPVGVQQLQQPLSVGPYDVASDGVLQYGLSPPQRYQPFGYPFFHVSGLLQRLLFGRTIFGSLPLDSYSPLCSRLTAIGRFLLDRVFEPLFATSFFMAASYLFRTSVLPRIAHYIHVYAMLKDHEDDGRFANSRQITGYLDTLIAVVNDVVNEDKPCLRRIFCEAGLQTAKSPVAQSVQSIAKIIISKHELVHLFKESLTGSILDCSQYMCKNDAKFKMYSFNSFNALK